jgi:cytoskeletal protein RodZ
MSSFGEELRRERELRGIPLREVAEATKVNLRYLQALERNEFEHLPGGVFNRGFVRAYAQYIGVDPDGMVDAYLLEEQAQASKGKARDRDSFLRSRAPAEPEPDDGSRPQPRRGIPTVLKWSLLALATAALVVAAVLIYLHFGSAKVGGTDAGREVRIVDSRATR